MRHISGPISISILAIVLLISACANSANTLLSKDLLADQKIKKLSEKIELKSIPDWAEFSLYDVNSDASLLPGASHKDFKIILKVKPGDVDKWLAGKEGWITSFPHKCEWVKDLLDASQLNKIKTLVFLTLYDSRSGYQYTLWVNRENGVIIMRYIQG